MHRRIPLPLLAVLAVVLVQGLAWTFAVPALQGADEAGHVAYVQRIADAHDIPWTRGATLDDDFNASVSSEQRLAWTWAGLEPLRGNLAARPLWSEVDERLWAREAARLGPDARTDGQTNPAFKNPPLYYLAAAVPYELAGDSYFARVWAMRLANLPLLLITVWLTWLLAGEVFGRRRGPQTVAAGVVGMHPVLLDVTTRVTPDALLNALGALALYLMVRAVRRGLDARLLAAGAVTAAAAALTHGRAVGIVPAIALAFALAAWRRRGGAERRPVPLALGLGGAAAVALAFGLFADRLSLRGLPGFASYLWQFYLPALPGMSPPAGPPWGAEQVYLDRFFATFVQFEVRLPADLHSALRLAIWLGLALLAVALWRQRRRLAERRDVVAVLVAAAILEILALHAAAFRSLLVNPADPVITGRYLLILVPLFGLAVAGALSALPARARAAATGATLAGAFLLALSAFGLVVARFYA